MESLTASPAISTSSKERELATVQDVEQHPGLTCSLCGAAGIKDAFNLKRHLSRMHFGVFKCSICKLAFSDRHTLMLHYPDCFHYCPIVGCSYKEKRNQRMEGHLRMHSRL